MIKMLSVLPVALQKALAKCSFITHGQGSKQTRTYSLWFTPALAFVTLETNTNNRAINANHVKGLALEMKRGKWFNTGTPIIIDENGVLLDGQHKLHAIVTSGIPREFSIMIGADPNMFPMLDQGVKRTLIQTVRWAGLSVSYRMSDLMSYYYAYRVYGLDGLARVTYHKERRSFNFLDIVELYKKKKDIKELTMMFENLITGKLAGGCRTSAIGMSAILLKDNFPKQADDIMDFAAQLFKGSKFKKPEALRAYDYILEYQRKTSHRYSINQQTSLMIQFYLGVRRNNIDPTLSIADALDI